MKNRINLKIFLLSIFILLISFNIPSLALSKSFQLGHVNPAAEQDLYHIPVAKFIELVYDRTNGEIEITEFPNCTIGNDRALLEGMQLGTVDMALVSNAPIGSFAPAFMALDLPFIFPSAECAHQVLDGPTGRAILDTLDPVGIKGLAFTEAGFMQILNNVRPIEKPEDVQGVKFRVMETPVYLGMFKAMGTNAIPMPWDEVYTAIQQGVMDGLTIPIGSIYNCGYGEIVKYLSLTKNNYNAPSLQVSHIVWDTLSEEEQQILLDSALDAANYGRERIKEIEADLLIKLEEQGMEITTEINKRPFQEAVRPLYEDFRDQIGSDLLDSLLEETNKCQ